MCVYNFESHSQTNYRKCRQSIHATNRSVLVFRASNIIRVSFRGGREPVDKDIGRLVEQTEAHVIVGLLLL